MRCSKEAVDLRGIDLWVLLQKVQNLEGDFAAAGASGHGDLAWWAWLESLGGLL